MRLDVVLIARFLLLVPAAVRGSDDISNRPGAVRSVVKETLREAVPSGLYDRSYIFEKQQRDLNPKDFKDSKDSKESKTRKNKTSKISRARSSKSHSNDDNYIDVDNNNNRQCNSELFGGLWTYVGGMCRNLYGVLIGCGRELGFDEGEEGMCVYNERILQYANGDDTETACETGGMFHGTNSLVYDECSGDCVLEHLDLSHDPCELRDNGAATGLKAIINVKNDKDKMLLFFSHDGGETYYNQYFPREGFRIEAEDDDDEGGSFLRGHSLLLDGMDRSRMIASSDACAVPTNYSTAPLKGDDWYPSDFFIQSEPDYSNIKDTVQAIPKVIDKIAKGITSPGSAITLVGNIINVGQSFFPLLGVVGGGLKILGSLWTGFEGEDSEQMKTMKLMNATLNKMSQDLDEIKATLETNFGDIKDKINQAMFLTCWTDFTSYDENKLADIRTHFELIMELRQEVSADNPPSQIYNSSLENFEKECKLNVPYTVLRHVSKFAEGRDNCWRLAYDQFFVRFPDDFVTYMGSYVSDLLLELQILQGICQGLAWGDEENTLFTTMLSETLVDMKARPYCKDSGESERDEPNCDDQHYCNLPTRRCVPRKQPFPTPQNPNNSKCQETTRGSGAAQARDNMCLSKKCNYVPYRVQKNKQECWRVWYSLWIQRKCKTVTVPGPLIEEYRCE
mmetsp:Transcript_46548/g.52058  ORF Transcript_46548/g.52058 Transcript_46548/m.52058 type:complete len:679 (+) Transcript_46548:190-2226(+)